MRNASFLRYPSRSKNELFLLSAARNTENLFDLEACPANLICSSFGNATVMQGCEVKSVVSVALCAVSSRHGSALRAPTGMSDKR
jgi:hypothetical protein